MLAKLRTAGRFVVLESCRSAEFCPVKVGAVSWEWWRSGKGTAEGCGQAVTVRSWNPVSQNVVYAAMEIFFLLKAVVFTSCGWICGLVVGVGACEVGDVMWLSHTAREW
ncbi:unnamed protein product [Ostreobium quekettii]|uniref:Uncharacterized protein n=1 Tax=Ostreobium quekettii TaxID=121088 RepID=A0A8S1ISU1_9CHLO|nr:unnamed protein product [Ostreobium quekettii]